MLPGLAEQIAGIRRTRARDLIEKRRIERGYKSPLRADALPQRSESVSHMTAENRAKVIALAEQHGMVSVPIARKAIGINDSSMQRLLRKMAEDGELQRLPYSVGTGVPNIYVLPGHAQSVGLSHFCDPQVRARVEKIAVYLRRAGGPLLLREIADAVGEDLYPARRALKRLLDDGTVTVASIRKNGACSEYRYVLQDGKP